ncbi:hypothetical protein SSP531S_13510 [Streptomyces spongiicola]|uniref:Uncharacterized protein n=1 Tax=Streptomyces spongiicola TaxID=1690221 RepID=A0A388STK1_9ACTN|nr:hypothetical protein SSP531S_13510 [Streptomyces spongiicola]
MGGAEEAGGTEEGEGAEGLKRLKGVEGADGLKGADGVDGAEGAEAAPWRAAESCMVDVPSLIVFEDGGNVHFIVAFRPPIV